MEHTKYTKISTIRKFPAIRYQLAALAYILTCMDIVMILWMGPYYGVRCPSLPVHDRERECEWAIVIVKSL